MHQLITDACLNWVLSALSCELLVFSFDQLSYEIEANKKISAFPSERNSRSMSGASTGRAKWLLIPHVTCWHAWLLIYNLVAPFQNSIRFNINF